MSKSRGCFKTGCFGCLGFIALVFLITGVTALLAWNDAKDSDPRDEVLAPLAADANVLSAGHPGRVLLEMSQGDFRIYPAEPGEGLRVEAEYDGELFQLDQEFSTQPDSSWQFVLDFHRTSSGMRAFLQSAFSKGPSARINVYLPPDVPMDLVLKIAQGGAEMDLGGLWLKSADIAFHQGGGELEFSEPLKEPMSMLRITCAMGGGAFDSLGNASPESLEITSSMGGAEVDLGGNWLNDCDVNISAKMGGMSVFIPKDVKVLRGADAGPDFEQPSPEVPEPVLRLRTKAKFGEIEIIH